MIHAVPTDQRQAVLTDSQLRADITARFGLARASTVFSALMEGSHVWRNPVNERSEQKHNDFYDYFVIGNGSGTLPNTATMNCWELFYHTSGATPVHVAVSLGGDQVISLWSQPNNVSSVQRIQVGDIAGTVYVGDPPW